MLKGKVHLVGAGPGDPELLTVKAYRLIQQGDVIVYDRLVGKPILELASPQCEMIYAGKRKHLHAMSQSEINKALVNQATKHACVVRLKGGDSLIFSRINEELTALNDAGIDWEITPGITAASGAAASSGVPITCRGTSNAVTYLTAHSKNGVLDVDWELATRPNHTVIFYMGLSVIEGIVAALLERGVAGSTPFHVIANATRPDEIAVHSTLGAILSDHRRFGLPSPAILMLGPDQQRAAVTMGNHVDINGKALTAGG